MSARASDKIRDYAERNATGLISPANSGLIIALALFECADALREQTAMHKYIMEEEFKRRYPFRNVEGKEEE